MSLYHTGNIQPQLDYEEHAGLAKAKRTVIVGSDGSNYFEVKVNSSGQLSTTGGGGGGGAVTTNYEYAEDSAHASGNVGAFALGVRNALLADLTDSQLDYSPIATDAKGRLIVDPSSVTSPVTVQNNVNVTGPLTDTELRAQAVDVVSPQVDGSPYGQESASVFVNGYILDETIGTSLSENDAAAARIDSKRAQICTIEDETTRGRRATVTAANALKVDGSAVTQPVDTELPAAAALADGATNPTTPLIGSCHHELHGTTWDRVRNSFTQTRTGLITSSGAGTSVDMTTCPMSKFGLHVYATAGVVSAFNISIEGSLDNNHFTTLLNGTSATGNDQIFWTGDKPVSWMRSNVTSITGSGGTVTVNIIATR